MKVIIIKDYNNYKVNDVIQVADGYAKNFLIKNGFALPMNATTKHKLRKNIDEIKIQENQLLQKCKKIKFEIEKIVLEFKLKTTKDIVHGSITNKQILKKMKDMGFAITKYNLPHTQINLIGISKIEINLHKDVKAILKIKVESDD